MAKLQCQNGTTSHVLLIFIGNSSSTTGTGLSGLLFNTSGLTCYYKRNTGTASVAVTLATITTLGTYTTGGFKEIDATHMPGWYEFHPPDAAFAASATSVGFQLQGATNMAPLPLEIELTATNNQDAVRGGMTALPNANAAANGGIPTVDTTNAVKIQSPIRRNTALANFPFQMTNSAATPQTGLTVSSTVSIDSGAFGATTNSATEIANGWYTIDLAAADMNGTVIKLRFTAGGAADTDLTLFTQP